MITSLFLPLPILFFYFLLRLSFINYLLVFDRQTLQHYHINQINYQISQWFLDGTGQRCKLADVYYTLKQHLLQMKMRWNSFRLKAPFFQLPTLHSSLTQHYKQSTLRLRYNFSKYQVWNQLCLAMIFSLWTNWIIMIGTVYHLK